MPFQFLFLPDTDNVLITNFVGEYVSLSRVDFDALVDGQLAQTDILNDLVSKHIICSEEDVDNVLRLLAIKFRSRKQFLYDFTSLHMVVLTLRCNSCCVYCHASRKDMDAGSSYDMDKKTAKAVVNKIFMSPSRFIKIEFQGGEPLLNEKVLRFIVKYATLKNLFEKRNLEFVVCTNLSLINEKLLHFFRKYNVHISTSLDGKKEIHDFHRKIKGYSSSYDVFVRSLKLSRYILGKININALVTITRHSVNSIRSVIDEYVNLGFNCIFIRELNPYGFARRAFSDIGYDAKTYVNNYKDAIDYLIELNLRGVCITEFFASIILKRMCTPFSTSFVDMQSPAGVGIDGVIYNYNGKVYVSDEGRMLSEMGDDKFCLGSVFDKYNNLFDNHFMKRTIGRSSLECLEICNECVFMPFCGADPVRTYLESGDETKSMYNSNICIRNKGIFEFFIDKIENGNREEKKVLLSWAIQ
ncbi:MAG: His-Xaa-Ser system radical SAM maturase HxsB [Christensenellaceae bacterium]|jgi:His-Xaa-Ser system radical SAM maturase HxsB|nr:His-Xaa-Ser system radical SAM maturase HxsB [Christensenellaceae bacterium]